MADLEEQGFLVKIEPHSHAVGICERSKTVVEPRISTQWFCKMKPTWRRRRLRRCGITNRARKYDSDYSGQPADGIFRLDGQHPGLDDFAATVVGAPDSGVALRGLRKDYGGADCAGGLRALRVGGADAGPGRSGHVV